MLGTLVELLVEILARDGELPAAADKSMLDALLHQLVNNNKPFSPLKEDELVPEIEYPIIYDGSSTKRLSQF
ncbi:hypothetical protein C0J52_27679 [Blattella germanica]|nr:hypothetical protein C0J52_27679 [Blattella germanica]